VGFRFIGPKYVRKDDANEVAPWTAPKWDFPIHKLHRVVSKYILELKSVKYLPLNPNTALAAFNVTCLDIRVTFR
jgi:hypothetical protein